MTTEEINKYIHVEIMGKCWHTPMIVGHGNSGRNWQCADGHCNADLGYQWDEPKPADYCSDDSPRRLLNEVVAKVIDADWLYYDHALKAAALRGEFFAGLVYTATAEQIARACVDAHREGE